MSDKFVIRSQMGGQEYYWCRRSSGDRRSSMWTLGDLQTIRVYDTAEQAQEVVRLDIQNPVAVGILKLTDAQWERIKEARSHEQERRHASRGRFMMKELSE